MGVTWGDEDEGGDSNVVGTELSSGVAAIYANKCAFAAVKDGGAVVAWGGERPKEEVQQQLMQGVVEVFSHRQGRAFAALKDSGAVVTWGPQMQGGDSRAVADQLSDGVVSIAATAAAFAAMKETGAVVTWGDSSNGGCAAHVSNDLSDSVVAIRSTSSAFAAMKKAQFTLTQ